MNKNFQKDFNSEIDGVISSIKKIVNAIYHNGDARIHATPERLDEDARDAA